MAARTRLGTTGPLSAYGGFTPKSAGAVAENGPQVSSQQHFAAAVFFRVWLGAAVTHVLIRALFAQR